MTEWNDGDYTVDVTLTGGSGKASVESPAELHVEGQDVQATIVWSSSHYDYMEVDGTSYYPVNEEGNSTFVITVPEFDAEIPILAETTAMSQPHMIEYTLRFDSATVQERGHSLSVPWITGVLSVVILAALVLAIVKKRKKARR